VLVRGSGFLPGERVTIRLQGAVLGEATATGDGSVETTVQIPRETAVGATTLDLVGVRSTMTAGVALEVAAGSGPMHGDWAALPWPMLSAALALATATSALALVAGRRWLLVRGGAPIRSA
jgi:hypothetical protein